MESGVKLGPETKHTLKTGICGEHGGEKEESVQFCSDLGMDYVTVPLSVFLLHVCQQLRLLYPMSNAMVPAPTALVL